MCVCIRLQLLSDSNHSSDSKKPKLNPKKNLNGVDFFECAENTVNCEELAPCRACRLQAELREARRLGGGADTGRDEVSVCA